MEDVNHNGQIDYTEFVAMSIDKRKAMNDVRIETCFKMFDANGDG